MSEPATIAAIVSAAAAASSTGYAISQGGGGGWFDPSALASSQQSTALKGAVPRSVTEAAARGTGGASPEFFAGLAGREAGVPGGGVEALDLVQQFLRRGQV